ncbi:MAG: hypothetical protein ACOYO1_19100 [Bacteroidales bacterium]
MKTKLIKKQKEIGSTYEGEKYLTNVKNTYLYRVLSGNSTAQDIINDQMNPNCYIYGENSIIITYSDRIGGKIHNISYTSTLRNKYTLAKKFHKTSYSKKRNF